MEIQNNGKKKQDCARVFIEALGIASIYYLPVFF